jgi:hypothetical protein
MPPLQVATDLLARQAIDPSPFTRFASGSPRHFGLGKYFSPAVPLTVF